MGKGVGFASNLHKYSRHPSPEDTFNKHIQKFWTFKSSNLIHTSDTITKKIYNYPQERLLQPTRTTPSVLIQQSWRTQTVGSHENFLDFQLAPSQ